MKSVSHTANTAHHLTSLRAGFFCAALGICAVMVSSSAVLAETAVFFSSPDFAVDETDLEYYLSAERDQNGQVMWGSPDRVRQAISELYVLKVLERESNQAEVLSQKEKAWIAYYQVALAGVRALMSKQISDALESHDWSREAREFYTANKSEFVKPESVTVSTLLLKTETRTYIEAIEMASHLAEEAETTRFADLVVQHTEDTGNPDGWLQVTKGQTVPEFEKAAFGLAEPGEVSDPVVTQYGVHLIQLLDKTAAQVTPFEEVEQDIISRVKQKRMSELAASFRMRPHREPPGDVIKHEEDIARFMAAVAAEHERAIAIPPDLR